MASTLYQVLPTIFVAYFRLLNTLCFLSCLSVHLAVILIFVVPITLLFDGKCVQGVHHLSHRVHAASDRVRDRLRRGLRRHVLLHALRCADRSIRGLSTIRSMLRSGIGRHASFSIFSHSVIRINFVANCTITFL